jgi:hypothetical protein
MGPVWALPSSFMVSHPFDRKKSNEWDTELNPLFRTPYSLFPVFLKFAPIAPINPLCAHGAGAFHPGRADLWTQWMN